MALLVDSFVCSLFDDDVSISNLALYKLSIQNWLKINLKWYVRKWLWPNLKYLAKVYTRHTISPSLSYNAEREEGKSNDRKVKGEIEGNAVFFPQAPSFVCFNLLAVQLTFVTVNEARLISLRLHLVGIRRTAYIFRSSVPGATCKSGISLTSFQIIGLQGEV
jgi:hypothetical protein